MSELNVTASEIHNDGRVRKMNRETMTLGQAEAPVTFYRAENTIFAGFRLEWVSGDDGDGVTFESFAGAGCGSKYMTFTVTIDGTQVEEYVDITEVLMQRVNAIKAEVRDAKGSADDGAAIQPK